MFKWINGIKCLVKYRMLRENHKTICAITVYTKIYTKPLELILDDIDETDGFNPRAAIRKLKINIGGGQDGDEPHLDLYDDIEDVYVDTYSDYVYFMTPAHVISYVYGSNSRYVTFELQNADKNFLKCNIIDPQSLVDSNKVMSNQKSKNDPFEKIIDPARLFKYL